MKARILNIALLISSLFAYLEWGNDQHSFLFEAEQVVIQKMLGELSAGAHPLVLLPLLGHALLLMSLFQKKVSRRLSIWGIICLSILLVFIFLVGIISLNYKIIFSCLPFILLSWITWQYHQHTKRA